MMSAFAETLWRIRCKFNRSTPTHCQWVSLNLL